jgi:hypothetical protein
MQHRTLIVSKGGLRGYCRGSGSYLSDRKGYGAVTCTVALDHVSL